MDAVWDTLAEGDKVTVTLPVTVRVVGFGRRHVWVETEDMHRFAIRRESTVVINREADR